VRPTGGAPNMQAQSHLDIAASGDLVTRLMHTVWSAGVLDLTLDENSGLESPIPLTAALLAGPLGAAAEGVDRAQPLRVAMRPLVPPVARTCTSARTSGPEDVNIQTRIDAAPAVASVALFGQRVNDAIERGLTFLEKRTSADRHARRAGPRRRGPGGPGAGAAGRRVLRERAAAEQR